MKKKLLAVLAIVLVIAMSVAGTYAYLTAKTQVVTNTFTVGQVIDENGLVLNESRIARNVDGSYYLNTAEKTDVNSYTVMPGVDLPKDPKVSATGVKDAAYLFVEVVEGDNFDATVYGYDVADCWTKLDNVKGANGGDVYVYTVNGSSIIYADVAATSVLKGDKVTVANFATGSEPGPMSLSFNAYICQAAGFDSAAAAYTACFAK